MYLSFSFAVTLTLLLVLLEEYTEKSLCMLRDRDGGMVEFVLSVDLTFDIIAAAAGGSNTEKATPAEPVNNKVHSSSGLEDLFQDSPSITLPSNEQKPNKDVKNDIMSLFEKVLVTCFISISYIWSSIGTCLAI